MVLIRKNNLYNFLLAIVLNCWMLLDSCYAIPELPKRAYTEKSVCMTINQIMQKHFLFNKFNKELAQRAVKKYLLGSDPKKMILLQEEVGVLDRVDLEAVVRDYNASKLDIFLELDSIVQVAYSRFEEICKKMEENTDDLYAGFVKFMKEEEREIDYSERVYADNQARSEERISREFYIFCRRASTSGKIPSAFAPSVTKQTIAKYLKWFQKCFFRTVYLYRDLSKVDYCSEFMSNPSRIYCLAGKVLATSLDANSSFHSLQDEIMSMKRSGGDIGLRGLYDGVHGFYVAEIVAGSVLDMAGIQPGSYIKLINGHEITSAMPVAYLSLLLQGSVGDAVNLTVLTYSYGMQQEEEFSLRYEHLQNVPSNSAGGVRLMEAASGERVGVLKFDSFSCYKNYFQNMKKSLEHLKHQGMDALVIDLRNNGGGNVQSIAQVLSLFLYNCEIYSRYERASNGEYTLTIESLPDEDKRVFYGPVVVLTSRRCASAAECFTQALKEYGLAVVVGDETTFGKGTVQRVVVKPTNNNTISNAFTSKLKTHCCATTVGFYYSAKGYSPQFVGVPSDIIVMDKARQLEYRGVGESFWEYALVPPKMESIKQKKNVWESLWIAAMQTSSEAIGSEGYRVVLGDLMEKYQERDRSNKMLQFDTIIDSMPKAYNASADPEMQRALTIGADFYKLVQRNNSDNAIWSYFTKGAVACSTRILSTVISST